MNGGGGGIFHLGCESAGCCLGILVRSGANSHLQGCSPREPHLQHELAMAEAIAFVKHSNLAPHTKRGVEFV